MRYYTIICLVLFSVSGNAQTKFDVVSVLAFQQKLNQHFADSIQSPLTQADLATFKELDFFPPNDTFFVLSKLVRTPNESPFEMATTTSRKPKYVKYGELHFKIKRKKFKLNVYQSLELPKNPLYKNYLFLPFTDRTSGVETYGGGRYIDLQIPEGDTITIDFNTAYNPYCAYNAKYSCPIVPSENDLNIKILAGVKSYEP